MAVYTDVGEEELAAFLAAYDLGTLLSYKGIAEGVENTNFLLHTGAGHFILTLYEKRVARGDLPFFLGLMGHLAERGITCPQPVKMRSGEALGELAGRPAAIFTARRSAAPSPGSTSRGATSSFTAGTRCRSTAGVRSWSRQTPAPTPSPQGSAS
jgi:homoserine kinase